MWWGTAIETPDPGALTARPFRAGELDLTRAPLISAWDAVPVEHLPALG
jgi:hypothetical protein